MLDGSKGPEAAQKTAAGQNRIAGAIAKLDLASHLKPVLHPVPLRDLKSKNVGQARLLDAKALETSLRDAIERALAEHKDEMRRLRALEVRHHEELEAERKRGEAALAAAAEEAAGLAAALERAKLDLQHARVEAEAFRGEARAAQAEVERLRAELEARPAVVIGAPSAEAAGSATAKDDTRDMPSPRRMVGVFDAPTEVRKAVVFEGAKVRAPATEDEAEAEAEAFLRETADPSTEHTEAIPLARIEPAPAPAYEAVDVAASPEAALLAEAMAAAPGSPAPEAAPEEDALAKLEALLQKPLAPAKAEGEGWIAEGEEYVALAPPAPETPASADAEFETAEEEEMLLAVLDGYLEDTSPDETAIQPAVEAAAPEAASDEARATEVAVDRILQAAFEMPVDLLEPTESMPAVANAAAPEGPAEPAPAAAAEAAPLPAAAPETPAPEDTARWIDRIAAEAVASTSSAPAPLVVGTIAAEAPSAEAEATACDAEANVCEAEATVATIEPAAEAAPAPAAEVAPLAEAAAAPSAETPAAPEAPVLWKAADPAPEAPRAVAPAPEAEAAPAAEAPAPAPAPVAEAASATLEAPTTPEVTAAPEAATPAPAPEPARTKSPAGAIPKAAFFGFGGGTAFSAASYKGKPADRDGRKGKRG